MRSIDSMQSFDSTRALDSTKAVQPRLSLQRGLTVTALALALAACASHPGKKDETEADAAKVEEKANSALFGGSWFGGKKKAADEDAAEKGESSAGETAESGAKKSATLPMVMAPGADKEAKAVQPQYAQAIAAIKAGNDDQALALLRDISNKHPNLSGPLLNQAILLRKKGRLQEAEDLLKKSLLSQTQNPRVMNELGVVSREMGNIKQAKASYESAIRLAPGYDRAHYNLAVLADLYLNDTALAVKEFEMYQSLQETRDKKVDGWLKELKRRAGTP